jgi:hypothetical protein
MQQSRFGGAAVCTLHIIAFRFQNVSIDAIGLPIAADDGTVDFKTIAKDAMERPLLSRWQGLPSFGPAQLSKSRLNWNGRAFLAYTESGPGWRIARPGHGYKCLRISHLNWMRFAEEHLLGVDVSGQDDSS